MDAWSDRVNPIVVRDVRQGLRSRAFVVTFTLLLTACLIGALTAASEADDRDTGEVLFATYTGFLYFVGCLLQPMGAFRAFSREREGEVWAPLMLSGLRARAILRGKIVSQLVQGAFLASSIVPFLAFAYLLGGVSLIAMAAWLAGAFAAQALLTTVAIAGATFADSKRNRWVSQAFAGLALWFGLAWGIGGLSLVGTSLTAGGSPLLAVLGAVLVWVTLIGLVFELSAAKLMAWGEDYVTGPRVAAAAHIASVMVLGTAVGPSGTGVAIGYALVLSAAFGFMGGSELPPPAGKWLQERRWAALRPGPLTSFGLFLMVEAVLLLLGAALQVDAIVSLVGVAAMLTTLLSAGITLVRPFAARAGAAAVRGVTAAIGGAWMFVIANMDNRDSPLRNLLLPADAKDGADLVVPVAIALVAAAVGLATLARLERNAAEVSRA